MTAINLETLSALPTVLGYAPANGVKGLAVDLDFTQAADGVFEFDFLKWAEKATFGTVQAVWIENTVIAADGTVSGNNGILSLNVGGFAQTIAVPAFSNGMFPVIPSGAGRFTARHSFAEARTRLVFLNVPQPYFVHPLV